MRQNANRRLFGPPVFALLIGIALAACTQNPPTNTSSQSTTIRPMTAQNAPSGTATAEGQVAVAATTTSGITSAARTAPEYGIGPGDVLTITVFNVPNLTSNVQVNVDGTVLLPLIGPVKVAGLTTTEAAHQIADRLAEKYLRSPQVTVFVAHSSQRISVNGAVKTPGVITLDGSLTLSQAVAQAGGLTNVADENRVHIARLGPDQTVKDTVYDLEAISGGTTRDPRLESGDIIVVETSGMKTAYRTFLDLVPALGVVATIALLGGGF
jgi:polysaccharide biosynthesis/export protein